MAGAKDPADDLAELTAHLDTVRLGDSQSLVALTRRLSELWDAQAISYRPMLGDGKWEIEFGHSAGFIPEKRFTNDFRDYLAKAPVQWTLFNPLRPQPEQRNRVWGDREMPSPEEGAETLHVVRHFYKKAGIFGLSQMRTLVCDGPVLLAWVGGFREEPFSARERSLLENLVEPLQRRLRVERLLNDHGATAGGLVAALDEIASPALLVREDGSVRHANATALRLLELEGMSLLKRIRQAIQQPEADASMALTPIVDAGLPRHFLVVLRGEATNVALRLTFFQERWKLTAKQTEVLLMVVRGEQNKVIADKLGVALVTVENHVTALLRKAKVENRASLVARFWTAT